MLGETLVHMFIYSDSNDMPKEIEDDNFIYNKHVQDPIEEDKGIKHTLLGYALLALIIVCYYIVIISDQLISRKTNILQLNVVRYAMQTILLVVAAVIDQTSLKTTRTCIPYVCAIAFSEILYATAFYYAASIMPAGNIEGFFSAMYIIISTSWDLFRKQISRMTVVAVVIAVTGLLLILQPWTPQKPSLSYSAACDTMDGQKGNFQVHNELQIEVGMKTSNVTDISHKFVSFYNNISSDIYFAYSLAIMGALASTVVGAACKKALSFTQTIPLLFWIYITESISCLVITLFWNMYTNTNFTLPHGNLCLALSLIFVSFQAIMGAVTLLTYKYLPVSAMAMSWPLVTVLLYISQRTFLAQFHPGNSNTEELTGIILITFAALLAAAINILHKSKAHV